jgi:hypothetical protein
MLLSGIQNLRDRSRILAQNRRADDEMGCAHADAILRPLITIQSVVRYRGSRRNRIEMLDDFQTGQPLLVELL